jgi:hypothetical protein
MSTSGPKLRAAGRLLGRVPAEARHLHAVEQEGESGETPFLALLGVSVFLVLPVFLAMVGLAVAAYYLA